MCASGAYCGPTGARSTAQTCDADAGVVSLTMLELGSDADVFAPLADGAHVQTVRGFQGGDMLLVRLRITATPLPFCVAQTTTVSDAATGAVLATETVALEVHPDGETTATT